jgi:hypothetical protein
MRTYTIFSGTHTFIDSSFYQDMFCQAKLKWLARIREVGRGVIASVLYSSVACFLTRYSLVFKTMSVWVDSAVRVILLISFCYHTIIISVGTNTSSINIRCLHKCGDIQAYWFLNYRVFCSGELLGNRFSDGKQTLFQCYLVTYINVYIPTSLGMPIPTRRSVLLCISIYRLSATLNQ